MSNQFHGKKKVKSSHSLFVLGCGCKDAKSVSVSRSTTETTTDKSSRTPRRGMNHPSSTETLTLPSISTSSCWEGFDDTDKLESSDSTPSLSGLLRELNELEQNVKELEMEVEVERERCSESPPPLSPREDGGMINGGRLEKSIAIMKDSADPFGDFKKSMLQMIVENRIVTKEEMQELLQRFLLLNSPANHDFIVRAFMDIWNEVFTQCGKTSKSAPKHGGNHRHYRSSKKL